MNLFILLLCCFVIHFVQGCASGQRDTCEVLGWAPWSNCSSNCGTGIMKRSKYICCPASYLNLDKCLKHCKIQKRWWNSNAVQEKVCGNCHNRGHFDQVHRRCTCPKGFGGSCCNGMHYHLIALLYYLNMELNSYSL